MDKSINMNLKNKVLQPIADVWFVVSGYFSWSPVE